MRAWRSFGSTGIRSVARGLFLFALTLTTLEVAARVDDWASYGASPWRRYDIEGLFRQTGSGLRGIPHARYVHWELNGLGVRGPELREDSGQRRVVTYGASETFGMYERSGSEFPRALEAELNARASGSRFEVVNAGIPGMRVGSGIELLRELGAQVRPAVVVVYPTPTHYIGVSRPYCGRPPRAPQPPGGGLDLRIAGKAKDELKALLPQRVWLQVRRLGIAWAARSSVPLERVEPRSLEAFEFDLHCAVRTIREIGAVPVLATHASRFGAGRRDGDLAWLVGWRMQYPELKEEGFTDLEDRANEVMRRVAAAEGAPLADAAAVLGGQPAYFADHAHFSEAGAARMGALLADAILGPGAPASHDASRLSARP